ncbi:MAG: fused MFS/spermidine synthase [Candidatus Obscuribacterales bacterium]
MIAKASFASTILLGAGLLFLIQPLVGKIVTAQFGGSAAIWCVCLLFFQLALLLGYMATYVLTRLPIVAQAIAYGLVWILSLLFLSLPPPQSWYLNVSNAPVLSLLSLLALYLSLPCLLLSSLSGLLQSWYAHDSQNDPYPLYSLSNIGSMSALLLYPLLIERFMGVAQSLVLWKIGYMIVAALAVVSSILILHRRLSSVPAAPSSSAPQSAPPAAVAPPTLSHFISWLGLSALGCMVLLVYTTYITQDVAPVPLLWVIPLALYLLTFIICFADERNYSPRFYLYTGPALWLLEPFLHEFVLADLLCVLSMLFCFCMVTMGELYRRRPSPTHLPSFYLAIAGGGVLGSLFVNVAAPALFDNYAERYIVIVAMLIICLRVSFATRQSQSSVRFSVIYVVMFVVGCSLMQLSQVFATDQSIVARLRNFYGCLTVVQVENELRLISGAIIHGSQNIDPSVKLEPTSYYVRSGAIGYIDKLVREVRGSQPVKYGIIGLGVGTLAAYGRPNDQVVFYEIDPKVKVVADRYFTFLASSPATLKLVIADGRKALEQERDQNFDMLLLDAFNGDLIPSHLLTQEAIRLYLRHLKPDGVLLVHLSNRYADLEPVVANLAAVMKLQAVTINTKHGKFVAVSNAPLPVMPAASEIFIAPSRLDPSIGIWTDDYSNLFSAILSKANHK